MKRIPDKRLAPAWVATAVERIVAACQPQTIYVFGSRARGQSHVDSDLDLCIILPVPPADKSALRVHLWELLADLPFPKDILVSDTQAFSVASAHPNSVYRDVAEEGVALWEAGRLDPAVLQTVCL